jgi:tripartite-type tricarboxylate transporter receptor subunit TctC
MSNVVPRGASLAIAIAALAAAAPGIAAADPVADFYKGRQITMIIAHGVGTGYDVYARLLGQHMGRHIPGNPTFLPQNMLGASGITGANMLFNVSAKDGSVIGQFAHTVPLDPLIGQKAAKFDASKFNYLGNMEEAVGTCAVWHTAGINSFEDLKSKEVRFGASATTGPPSQMAAAVKNLLGAKINIVHGYKGVNGVKLAMEGGEVQGVCSIPLSTLQSAWADVYKSGRLKPILQLSGPKGALPGAAYAYDAAKTDADKAVFDLIFGSMRLGKLFAAPPGVPADRLKALRTAFDATMKDAAFLADARKRHIDISPANAAEVQAFIGRLYAAPPAAIERAKQAVVYAAAK